MRCTLENGEARSYGFGGCPLPKVQVEPYRQLYTFQLGARFCYEISCNLIYLASILYNDLACVLNFHVHVFQRIILQ